MAQDSRPEGVQPRTPGESPENSTAAKSENREAPARSKRWLPVVISLLVVAAVAYAGWRWYENERRFVSTDDAYIDANRLSLSSKVLGRVAQLNADETDTVRAGQILIQLDVSDLQAQRAQSQAALILAEQNVQLARVNLERAKGDLNRAQIQFQNNTMPAEQFEHAKNDLQTAQAKLAIAEAQVSSSKTQIAVLDTSLKNSTIISPMSGVISKRWVLPGDVVQPGQPVYSIYNMDSIWVTANLEETKLGRIQVGDSVTIHVDAYPDQILYGKVAQFASNTAAQFSLIPPNNASGNFTKVTQRVPIKIAFYSRDSRINLLPGMSVTLKVKA
jgi:membrane fusion protein, multidrug efflux system